MAWGVAFRRSAVACLYSGGNLHQQLTEVTDLYGFSLHEGVAVTRCEKALGLLGEERFTINSPFEIFSRKSGQIA